MIKSILLLLFFVLAFSCQTGNYATTGPASQSMHAAELNKIFEAHGGYDKWSEMELLTFDLDNGQHQVISLRERKVLIESEEKTIGFDGEEIWVTPDTADIGNARFHHSLFYYFYAMPFVIGDPGIIYKKAKSRVFLEEKFDGISISFKDAIGESPKDSYILYYNPETYQMGWLLYTVTYNNQEENDQYSLIKYNNWEWTNGLLLPRRLQWYAYENDSVGKVLSDRKFRNVKISTTAPSDELFEAPDDARIAPGPAR